MRQSEEVHYLGCNLCEAICGLEVRVSGEQILSIKGDAKDPLSKGHICPKAIALQDLYNDPERLRQPVQKTQNGAWQTITWEAAYKRVVDKFLQVQSDYGQDALGVYQGNPSVHSLGIMMFAKLFIKQLRTRNRYTATSLDQLPHHIVTGLMLGHEMLIPVPDIDRTNFMVILGANPVVSNGSMMTVPNVKNRLKGIQARGGQFWVVDPRRTETAELADKHIFIQPGSDAHLLAAMVNTVFKQGLYAPGRVAEFTDGLEKIETLVEPWTPEVVEGLTGISAQTIRDLVKHFCEADSAVLYGRMGVSTQEFGTLCQWLIVVFNIITGNFDKIGGAMFSTPAIDILSTRKSHPSQSTFSFNRYRSRVKNLPEMQGELPVTTLADELLTEGEGQIKALMVIAGNPVLSSPNGSRFSEALENLEFMVAVDGYINETSRHADLILPPNTILEREHYDLVFHSLAVRNTARFNRALFKSKKDSQSDTDIFLELAMRFSKRGKKLNLLDKLKLKFLKKWGIRLWLNKQLTAGPYGKSFKLNLKKLEKQAHGIDFGALQACLPERLFNANKRIVVAPDEITRDLPRLLSKLMDRKNQKKSTRFDMLLIGRRDPRTCNSWLHNSKRLTKGKPRCLAHIHPDDAKKLGLVSGNPIRVTSAVGIIDIDFEETDSINRGVISIPHGWGHDLPGVKMSCAVQNSGVSVNNLTNNNQYDALSGNAILNGVPVNVRPVNADSTLFFAVG